MTAADLDRWEALAAAATPGPWERDITGHAAAALLDALTVERFTTHRPERPAVTVEGPGRLFTATREATEPVTATCVACGTRVPIDQSCPQCRATRETKARRARLRAGGAR